MKKLIPFTIVLAFTVAAVHAQTPTPPGSSNPVDQTTPAHFSLASRSRIPDSTRMKGPSGRSLYVSTAPLLTASDIQSANPSGPNRTKIDSVVVRLNPSGIAKLAAATASSDQPMLVLVQGQSLIADQVEIAPYRIKNMLTIKGRFSESESWEIVKSLRLPREVPVSH